MEDKTPVMSTPTSFFFYSLCEACRTFADDLRTKTITEGYRVAYADDKYWHTAKFLNWIAEQLRRIACVIGRRAYRSGWSNRDRKTIDLSCEAKRIEMPVPSNKQRKFFYTPLPPDQNPHA
jgi:hypothetical protein